MPAAQQRLDRLRDVPRVALAVRRPARSRSCGEASVMPGDPAALPAVEDRVFSATREPARGVVERGEVDVLARRGRRRAARTRDIVNGARSSTSGRTRRWRGLEPVRRAAWRRARRGRGWWPSAASRAAPRSRSACARRAPASAARGPRRRSATSPASVIGACSRSRWLTSAPLSPPMPSDVRARQRARRGRPRPRPPTPRPPRRARRCRRPGTGCPGRSRATAACGAAGTRGPCRSA